MVQHIKLMFIPNNTYFNIYVVVLLQERSDVESKAARKLYNPLLETESTFVRVNSYFCETESTFVRVNVVFFVKLKVHLLG